MFPINSDQLDKIASSLGIASVADATIRQIVSLAAAIETECGEPMVHLELGNPGIQAPALGIEAECEALRNGVASRYPDIAGVPALKRAGSRFAKAFINVEVDPANVVPTVGSMQGCFTTMLLLGQRDPAKRTMLFINPGFPVQRSQARMLGLNIESFDIYDYRGKALEAKLESYLAKGDVTGIIYSNPNNPAWINLTDEELEIIGRLATRYDAEVMEDLAYLGMDFRCCYGKPFVEPYIPTVARYTDNYILFISGSKIFSYAGQRIAVVCISSALASRHFEPLTAIYTTPDYVKSYIYGVLYCASSGTTHSSQYAFAAMLDAACDEKLDFVEECREYERRSNLAREAFKANGFHLVYDRDDERPISDGFFFTVGYGDMSGADLQRRLLAHGIATIPLSGTGSLQPGVRVCVSTLATPDDFAVLNRRLAAFNAEYKNS